jgi:hypothetical protein
MKKFLLWSFILFLIVGGLAASFYGWRNVSRSLACTDWPSVDGKIIESGVEEERTRHSGSAKKDAPLNQKTYRPKITYSYKVDEQEYTGSRIAYGDHGFIGKSKKITINGVTYRNSNFEAKAAAQKIAKHYHTGKKISVFYMPDNPRESLLEPGFSYKVFAWPLVGIVMFVIGVFIGWLAIMSARDKDDEPEEAESASG